MTALQHRRVYTRVCNMYVSRAESYYPRFRKHAGRDHDSYASRKRESSPLEGKGLLSRRDSGKKIESGRCVSPRETNDTGTMALLTKSGGERGNPTWLGLTWSGVKIRDKVRPVADKRRRTPVRARCSQEVRHESCCMRGRTASPPPPLSLSFRIFRRDTRCRWKLHLQISTSYINARPATYILYSAKVPLHLAMALRDCSCTLMHPRAESEARGEARRLHSPMKLRKRYAPNEYSLFWPFPRELLQFAFIVALKPRRRGSRFKRVRHLLRLLTRGRDVIAL